MITKDWFTVISPYKPPTEHYKEISWCEEKFGQRYSVISNKDGIWRCFWGGQAKPSSYRFEFQHEQDAVLFSLTWL